LPADFVAVDSHIGYFETRSIVERLHTDIILPARKVGYQKIWLVGISLGGLAALLYSTRHANCIDGIVLLSPYLGSDKLIKEVKRVGSMGARKRTPEELYELRVWKWVEEYSTEPSERPKIFLGYGKQDKFKDAHQFLAEMLAPENVFSMPGKHNWKTWRNLWQVVLDNNILTDMGSADADGIISTCKNN
jgi:pimeloyl-ACP methyl ester carboxylesterase